MHSLSTLLSQLAVSAARLGSGSDEFATVMTPETATADALVFKANVVEDLDELLATTGARVFLVGPAWGERYGSELQASELSFHIVDDPRLTIARLLHHLHPGAEEHPRAIHETALVHPEAELHPSVGVGPYAVVGRCAIGEGSCIGAFTVVKDGAQIGANVRIREHCLIGGAGFGYARDAEGELLHIPHVGAVVIEDDVDIFPYVNVDRGTLFETRICRGAKIDHYCHIGHNTRVGEQALITGGTILCGGSQVGARGYMGAGSLLRESARVSEDATVGLGSVVLRNVPAGATVAGVPAKALPR